MVGCRSPARRVAAESVDRYPARAGAAPPVGAAGGPAVPWPLRSPEYRAGGVWLRRVMGAPAPEAAPRRGSTGGERRLLCIGADTGAIADLAGRLEQELPALEVVVASRAPSAAAADTAPPPADGGRRAAARWLAPLAPDLVLWHGALGADPLLDVLLEAPAPVIAVDVPAPAPARARKRRVWRGRLAALDRLLARDEAAAHALRQLGPAGMRIEVGGAFVRVPDPPPCEESDHDHYAQILHARPVWLAAFPTEAEIDGLAEAHRSALQGAHRLLLLVAPRDDAQGPELASRLRGAGWRVARHGAGEEPDDGTEIFVADSRDEIGLWYRLAPLSVMGGSFLPDDTAAADPADPARLGSAILAGPAGAPHEAALARLDDAGGVARVAELAALGPALANLLAPDRAAALAQAAWDVASDGARVQERIVAAIRDLLRDGPGAG